MADNQFIEYIVTEWYNAFWRKKGHLKNKLTPTLRLHFVLCNLSMYHDTAEAIKYRYIYTLRCCNSNQIINCFANKNSVVGMCYLLAVLCPDQINRCTS